ncbi:ferritin-like domain-containing protein [Candidatus Solirubrobacter pratensis]|uniref:ferritin-like domain-containing protein n=1 Tax=Candidatus Solirubrobacter pratensis TaxID=1298857 RepID=UPI0004230C5B|nr:ferritin-like domain-containing protein [Candidatus Solirubrobacter pratensis]
MSRQPERPNPPLPDEVSEEIGKQLQLTLVELIALSLAGKQSQWTSYGREFVSVHRHLDQVVGEWRELEDVVAGRAAAIGIALDWSSAAVIELDDHRPLEPGFTEVGCAVERLCSQLWDVALRVRRRGALVGTLDAVSQHVLTGVQRKLEDQLWMLRSQLAD